MRTQATTIAHKAHRLALSLAMLGATLVLSACGGMGALTPTVTAQPSEPAATSPTASPGPTLTETPSSTPTVTPTAGPSPTPVPTPAFGSARVGNDFLFGNQPEGCELPCWQGLVVGESNAQDVQKTFETAFGFLGIADMFPENAFVDSDIEGFSRLSHQWFFGDSGDTFFAASLIDKSTRVLEVVRLYGSGNQFEPYISPQRILRELGVPSHILVSLETTEAVNWASSSLIIIYDEGVTIFYSTRILMVLDQGQQAGSKPVAELCLDSMPKYPITGVFLTRPLDGEDMDTLLSPLRFMGVSDTEKLQARFAPFEEVFRLNLEGVTKLAQEKQNACIYAPIP